MRLTVKNTYEVDFQGQEPGRNGLSVHHSQGTVTNATRCFWDSRVRNLGFSKRYAKIGGAMVRGHTDHNVNSAITLECKVEEGKLIIPVYDIAFDRRGFSLGRAEI